MLHPVHPHMYMCVPVRVCRYLLVDMYTSVLIRFNTYKRKWAGGGLDFS